MARTRMLALVGVLLLAGCAPAADDPAGPTPSTSASQPPVDAGTTAPPTPPAPAVIPTDCLDVLDEATYATLGETPLNDPALQYPGGLGAVAPSDPPVGATNDEVIAAAVELRCFWRDPRADVSFLSLEAGRVSADAVEERLGQLADEGYTCIDASEGRQCQLVETDQQYPVEVADTQFVRDDVLIRIEQANVPTSGLMAAVVARVWP